MIFGKKRTIAQDMFDKAYATLPDAIKQRVAFQICFYDFLLHSIDKSVIDRIIADTGFVRTTKIEDIAYYNIMRSLKMDNFQNYPIMHIAPNNVEPIKSYKTDLLLCIANRNNNDIENTKRLEDEVVGEDDKISFIQMMAQVYAANGKEFGDSDFLRYKELYQEYSSIVNLFFPGAMKGLGRTDPKIVLKKALETINTLSECAVAIFATTAMLLSMWISNYEKVNGI